MVRHSLLFDLLLGSGANDLTGSRSDNNLRTIKMFQGECNSSQGFVKRDSLLNMKISTDSFENGVLFNVEFDEKITSEGSWLGESKFISQKLTTSLPSPVN
jgi:hypothetical protein